MTIMDFAESDFYYNSDGCGEDGGETALIHQASASGDLEVLKQVIREDPSLLEQQDADGITPLSYAVRAGRWDSVKLLVKMGADINVQDSQGRTCLAMAAYQGWYDGVLFLTRNGARQNIADKFGRTALHCSTYTQDSRTLEQLIQNIGDEDLNTQDSEGMTSLHWASFHNRPNHVALLLAKGLDPLIQDVDGRTALHWVAQNGNIDCCSVLARAAKVLVNEPDFSGKRAVHLAAAAGHANVLSELASVHCADIQAEDNDDRTPLHWAAATGQTATLRTLLDFGADPNPVDIDDGTPLEYARQCGHQECVRILEEKLRISATDTSPIFNQNQLHLSDSAKTKRSPLKFLTDFFRGKRFQQQETNSSTACNNKRTALRESVERTHVRKDSEQQLYTPRKQSTKDVLHSIEKIHLSREDNPALIKLRLSKQSIDSSTSNQATSANSSHLVAGLMDNALSPDRKSSTGSVSSASISRSLMVRSPPPVLKNGRSMSSRDSSVSPEVSSRDVFSSRQTYTREKLELDAADILGLSRAGSQVDRDFSARLLEETACTNEMDEENAVSTGNKPVGGKIKLAPIKGPVPYRQRESSVVGLSQPPVSPLHPLIGSLRQEAVDSSERRAPTPPSWRAPSSQNRHANCEDIQRSFHDLNQKNRKKKRKASDKHKQSKQQDSDAAQIHTNEDSLNRDSVLHQRKAIDQSIRSLLK